MGLLDVIVVAWVLCHCDHARRAESRRIRAMRRLMEQYPPGPSYDSPSPHQLLGDIARPIKAPALRA
jgi:hypothetical protein